jgi:hypothetical protein
VLVAQVLHRAGHALRPLGLVGGAVELGEFRRAVTLDARTPDRTDDMFCSASDLTDTVRSA